MNICNNNGYITNTHDEVYFIGYKVVLYTHTWNMKYIIGIDFTFSNVRL